MIVKIKDTEKIKKFFSNKNNSFIRSAINNIMGEIYADDVENPKSAIITLGDFHFLAGEPNQELLLKIADKKYSIIICDNREWEIFIEKFMLYKIHEIKRYKMKNKINFDLDKLSKAVSCFLNSVEFSKEYSLKMIDEKIFNLCLKEEWSRDLVANFKNYEMYKNLGIGVAILKGNEIISGASSYLRYDCGIEIQTDTKKEYRNKGFAYICGAKLILECLKQNIYPSWDAHNKISVKLAEKLGYHLDYEYITYEIY